VRRTASPKAELLPGQSEALLRELHLVSRDGKLHADSLRKLKQVNHFAGLLRPALDDVLARFPKPLLLDAGAGNAYLGFILYELFLREGQAELFCVETRAELVERARERAARLGFSRIRFVARALEEAALAPAATGESVLPDAAAVPEGGLPERLHLVTALHACDTATDDALILAVRRKADHVALVPCCQAEVAAQLKASRADAPEGPMALLWAHPLHRREFAAHLTNVLRALLLESCGYAVTVTELTGWEHSLKNELILGRRVHKEHRGARARLRELLAATGARPKAVRELAPELLPAAAPPAAGAAEPASAQAAGPQRDSER
jgi:SAM-dependent methyltransferase